MELDGELHGVTPASSSSTAINYVSAGNLFPSVGTSVTNSGFVIYNGTLRNCFYLNGIQGSLAITEKTGETSFYKTSEDPEVKTTATVVEALNNFIELKGVLQEGDEEVDTTGWCKWVVGDNNLPALDFNKEWNGTSWVTVSN